jgi:uncharacterized protein YcfL
MDKQITKLFLVICFAFALNACSSRSNVPLVNDEEQQFIFPPKDSSGINVNTILYNKTDTRTKLPLGTESFTMYKNAKVYASVNIENYKNDKDLMFHIDWIDPGGNSFFKKRIDISRNDSLTEINSAISIEPGKRDSGVYSFRVYLFRELIAEKKFLLSNLNVDSLKLFPGNNKNNIAAKIILGGRFSKENHSPIDTGSTFYLVDRARIYASANIVNRNNFIKNSISCELTWGDRNDSLFYSKSVFIPCSDSTSLISSSVSISPKIRIPGKYKCKFYIYGYLVAAKYFDLVPLKKKKIDIKNIEGLNASLVFCSKINRKTREARGISETFTAKNKAKVFALVTLNDIRTLRDKNSKIIIEWIGQDNKTFFKKTFKHSSKKDPQIIYSSISISSSKRSPGKYKCRVFYNSDLICEKYFTLTSASY